MGGPVNSAILIGSSVAFWGFLCGFVCRHAIARLR